MGTKAMQEASGKIFGKNPGFSLTFYAIPVSTSCARTRIVLDHKKIPYTELPPPDGYASRAYKQLIAAGTVPGMVIEGLQTAQPDTGEADTGEAETGEPPVKETAQHPFALPDSAAQSALLDELFPDPPMMPAPGMETVLIRARLNALASFHDTRLEPAVRALFPLVKPEASRIQAETGTAVRVLQDRLDLLDVLANPHPFLGGSVFTHVDAAFPTTVYMGLDLSRELGIPCTLSGKIQSWLDRTGNIPAVAKTLALNRAAVKAWAAAKQ